MKIAYITAGAAGMYCGSCMHDNTLVAALRRAGHDALLIPTYTPIRTDEEDVSGSRVFFGGINVYLQQKSALFRWTPWFLDRLLDVPRLLRWVSRFAISTRAESLGELTLSMLHGAHGHQKKEIDKLVAFLEEHVQPEILVLTNVIQSGMLPELKRRLKIPIVGVLQGDDVFLESLPPQVKAEALALIRANCASCDGFLTPCRYYADFMAEYLGVERAKMHVVPLGINLQGFTPAARNDGPFTIGYFARICPEKGLHVLVDAFLQLMQEPGAPSCKLRISGWLGGNNRAYFDEQMKKLADAGLGDRALHVESSDHASKVRFLQSLDVLSVPTTYREPKGLYILEALACGVPVVQPRHGSFPELIDATGGGMLVEPNDPRDLARTLRHLAEQRDEARRLGAQGRQAVTERFHAAAMAANTLRVFEKHLS